MDTTLNVHVSVFEKVTHVAELKGVSRSDMIILLIKKVMGDISDPGRFGTMVRYQKRCGRDDWHTLHVQVKEDDYEFLLDLRKLLKMSVSLILAYAVEKFLDILINSNITDNYQYRNYILVKEIVDSIICWKFFWGYPRNIEKYLFPENNAG